MRISPKARKIEWVPNPGPQVLFLNCPADFIHFGGQKGGGKSEALLIWCLQHWDKSGYRSIFFRKTYQDLELHVIPRSRELLTGVGKYDEKNHRWRFKTPSGGESSLQFGYLQYPGDVHKYSGTQFARMAFDEGNMQCLTEEHEVLTLAGWKKIGEVAVGERVASLAIDKGIEFREVQRTHSYQYNGELKSLFQRSGISFRITPNHKCVIENKGTWRFVEAGSLPALSHHLRVGKWNGLEFGKFKLPMMTGRGLGSNQNSGTEIDADDWFRFVGWFLAEGNALIVKSKFKDRVDSTKPSVVIAQHKNPKLEEFLGRLPWRWRPSRCHGIIKQYWFNSKQLYEMVKPFAGDSFTKRIPRWMLGAHPRHLQSLLDGFIDGDGCRSKGAAEINLVNEGLIDDLQELCVRVGLVATKAQEARKNSSGLAHVKIENCAPIWRLSISKATRKSTGVPRCKVKDEPFSGVVRCLSVPPYNNFFVRHRGRVHCTGNSERVVRYMLGSLRSAVGGIRPQAALGTNPIGAGYGWLKKMFIEKRKPNVIYTDAVWPSDRKPLWDPVTKWGSTIFIPASVYTNLVLMKNDPGYIARLKMQSGKIAEALLHGSWEHPINLAIENWDDLIHTSYIKSSTHPDGVEMKPWGARWIGVDYGKTHAASAVWCYEDGGQIVLYRDHTVKGRDVVPFAHDVLDRCVDENGKREDIVCVVLSHELYADQGTARSRAQQFAEVFQKAGIMVIPSGRDPRGRLTLARELTRTEPLAAGIIARGSTLDYDYWEKEIRQKGTVAMQAYLELTQGRENEKLPKMLVLQPDAKGVYGCPDIIQNWPLLMCQTDPHPDPFILADGQEDDSWDAALYALMGWMGPTERPVMDIYRERMAGKMPDSPIAEDLMRQAIEKELDEAGGEFKAYKQEVEPFGE